MIRTLMIAGVLMISECWSASRAESWPGRAGGGAAHNASSVEAPPKTLKKGWHRVFAPVTFGDQDASASEMQLPGGRGSLNLTLYDGKIALLAADGKDFPESYYCSVLDALTGKTLNCIQVHSNIGNSRVYRWPYMGVSMSVDQLTGMVSTNWDPQTGILFLGQGAYNSAYTAYRPLDNVATYKSGAYQPAVAAFAELAGKHPAYEDAFGRTRKQLYTIFGPGLQQKTTRPDAWGLSMFFGNRDGQQTDKYDTDLATVFGRNGSSYYNTSAFFAIDPAGPIIGLTKGADWGHNIAGDAYLFNKHTGLKGVTDWPKLPAPLDAGIEKLRPFTMQGIVIANGRVFCAGPAEDRDGDKKLGVRRPEGLLPRLDQGLYLWAYDYRTEDRKPNDGVTGPAAGETITLSPAFIYKFASRYQPDDADLETYGQSYFETDGLHRPKPIVVDGKGMWMAWKPNQADPVELCYADDAASAAYPLQVGKGLKGVDIWPKISLAEVGSTKYISFFTGYAQHRRRFIPDDPASLLKNYTHAGGKKWSELSEKEQRGLADEVRKNGMWTEDLFAPRGPAELAVFDATGRKIRWTYNVSAHYPSIPANDFWTTIDQTAMVTAGQWTWIGWVDTTGDQAVLRLLAFDITADEPAPVEKTIDLGFPSKTNRRSVLFDLIAADGRLYALVTQSHRMWIRDPRWIAQHVIAINARP